MSIKIEVDCPKCGTVYKISAKAEGNLLKCKKCRHVIDLTQQASARSGGRAGTGRRSRGGTGRHQAEGGGGGRRKKRADVWPMVAICGFLLFVGLIVFLIVAMGHGGGEDPAASAAADPTPAKKADPAPVSDPPKIDNPFEDPKDPPRQDPPKQDPPPQDPPKQDPPEQDPPRQDPEDVKKSLGVRQLEVPANISASDRDKIRALLADIASGDPHRGDRARDELRLMGRYIAPMVLNEFARLDFAREDDRIAGICLTDVIDSFRRDGESFHFRDAAFGDNPSVPSLNGIRVKIFDWYDAGGAK